MPDQPPRTILPTGIPDSLKDFVRCRTNEVELEAGDLTWLPKPDTGGIPVPDVTPGLTFEPGPTPGSVIISVGWGFFNVSITGSIADGKLNVDAPPIPGLGPQITNWVNDLNADLEANGMELGDLSIRNGKLHFGKQAIAAVPETPAAVVPTPATQVAMPSPTPTRTPTPAPAIPGPTAGSKTAGFLDDWKGKAAVGGGVLALGVAAFFLFVDDGQPPGQSPPPATPAPAAATESTPAASDSTGTDPATTDDSTGTSAPSSGDDPPPATDTSEGDSVGALQLPENFYGGLDRFAEDAGAAGVQVMVHADALGDVGFCTPSEGFGADITGVTAYQSGNVVTAFVGMAESPIDSLEDFSWAVQFQPEFASGAYRFFVRQVHDGEHTEGEQLEDGTMSTDSEVEISVSENGLLFRFEVDESDPLAVGTAFGFNLRQDGDSIGCDQAVAAVSPSPVPINVGSGSCVESESVTCFGERFSAEVTFDDGFADVDAQSDDLAWFSFTDPNRVDLALQVINGCSFTNNYWVFAAATIDVEFELTVTDTATGEVRTYSNPLGTSFDAVTDTSAFATCP